ncbi:MAG: methionyl aminopeptidase [Phycisphaerae bacterium]|jgi:methionyl aminopeptidase
MSESDLHGVPPGLLRAGRIVSRTLDLLAVEAVPGASTRRLAARAAEVIASLGGVPVMATCVNAAGVAFGHAASICIDEEVTHAKPSSRLLRAGDVATIDVAASFEDGDGRWHADAARPIVVAAGDAHAARGGRLMEAALAVHRACEASVRAGVRWGACAEAALAEAASRRCRVVGACAGHGIGRRLHEDLRLGFDPSDGTWDHVLAVGETITVEPVVCEGTEAAVLVETDDGWTTLEATGRWSAYRETTVTVTAAGAVTIAG